MLSISGCWSIRLNNEFIFPDPEPPISNILYGWTGICGQFGLCSFMFCCTTSSKVNYFLYRFIILLHLSLLYHLLNLCLFHMHMFLSNNWLYSFIIVWISSNLVSFFIETVVPFTFKPLLYFWYYFIVSYKFFNTIWVNFIFFWMIYSTLKLSCF